MSTRRDGFKLTLRLHTPVILPTVTPRLDVLLQEAMSRLWQDWDTAHALPLARCSDTGVYCASQMIFGTTPGCPLTHSSEKLVSAAHRQDLHLARGCKKKLRDVGADGNKLTLHHGTGAPFAIFYGVGDPEQCATLLPLLGGIGREHARSYGSFTVLGMSPDTSERWRLRPWPLSGDDTRWQTVGERFTQDRLALTPKADREAVVRPGRLIREVVNVR